MASSSHSTSTQTSLSIVIVDVEHDAAKREFIKQLFSESYICLPDAYFTRMIHVGMADPFIKLVMDVNREEKQRKKMLQDMLHKMEDEYRKRKYQNKNNNHDTKNDEEETKLKQNKNSHEAISNEITYHYVPVFTEEDQIRFEEFFPDYSNLRKSFD
ncbi:unnamed protein product [Rotaria sordida]|uniref:Uncharacterized protein n=1 Tax=Rotaria sordida TaxID=392033 RepID=A0A815SMB6_9BILA|nr:unnamed protein product [Rotaria sordida]CAF1495218.1 unnamed protein product [Rotaria sordida]CAF4108489.1 unnamed protein product [Rotaria sordida]CAF4188013.1 unnamed protein product [Rotaria sordida]